MTSNDLILDGGKVLDLAIVKPESGVSFEIDQSSPIFTGIARATPPAIAVIARIDDGDLHDLPGRGVTDAHPLIFPFGAPHLTILRVRALIHGHDVVFLDPILRFLPIERRKHALVLAPAVIRAFGFVALEPRLATLGV